MRALPSWSPSFVSDAFNLRWPAKKLLSCVTAVRVSSSSIGYETQAVGRLPRLFSELLPHSKGGVVRVQGDEYHHMTRVLRLNAGDKVELFNGKGVLLEGCIQSVDRAGLEVVALEDPKSLPHFGPKWHVVAAFGTLKGGRADWLLEKCTELGASSVTPLLTDRSNSISDNRVDRLGRVILAAAKQCQRLHEMILHPPMRVTELLPRVSESKLSLLAAANAIPVASVLESSTIETSGLIIIGPEGDLTEKEKNLIVDAGAIAVGLGPLRLRVETATIALLSALMLWSDSHIPSNK